MKIQEALAHCDIPCKIYDPIVIQIAALTVVRIIDIIEEKKLDPSKSEDSAELSRLTLEKVATKMTEWHKSLHFMDVTSIGIPTSETIPLQTRQNWPMT